MDQGIDKARNKHRSKVTFKVGDLVWAHLRKERFPLLRTSKLSPRGDGPFKVLRVINVNVNPNVLDLPESYGASPTFNVGDLTLYEPRLDDTSEEEEETMGPIGDKEPDGSRSSPS